MLKLELKYFAPVLLILFVVAPLLLSRNYVKHEETTLSVYFTLCNLAHHEALKIAAWTCLLVKFLDYQV